MRTACSLTVSQSMLCSVGMPAPGGCLIPGGCLLQGGLVQGGSAPGGGLLLGGAWSRGSGGCLVQGEWGVPGPGGVGGAWSRGWRCLVPGEGRCLIPGGVVSQHALRQTPLWTEFLTHTSENITLPQISYAGGNNCSWYSAFEQLK